MPDRTRGSIPRGSGPRVAKGRASGSINTPTPSAAYVRGIEGNASDETGIGPEPAVPNGGSRSTIESGSG